MKFVVKKLTPKNQVALKDVSGSYYYGIAMKDGCKTFIIRQGYLNGEFRTPYIKDEMTAGNGHCAFESDTLENCIRSAIDHGDSVIEFETHKELFAWLAK